MEIRENPVARSKELRGALGGYRAATKHPIRVVFICCHECIGWGMAEEIACADCNDLHGEDRTDTQPIVKLFRIEDITSVRRAG